MSFEYEIIGDKRLIAKLDAVTPSILKHITEQVRLAGIEVEGHAKADKLGGQVLRRITGMLSQSIHSVLDGAGSVHPTSTVGTKGVPYAVIHEFGGTIRHPGGTAYFIDESKKARWVPNSDPRAQKLPRTKPHNITMPERSYLRSSLKDLTPKIVRDLQAAAIKGAKLA